MNKRIEYIDICKAIAIFAMVFAHCGLRMSHSDERLESWIHLWHMPVFFIISGAVLNLEKWKGWNSYRRFAFSRMKSLIVPFIVWGTICNVWLFFLLNICGLGGGKHIDVKLALLNYIDYNVVTISGTSWFLPAIFLTELFFMAIANVIGVKKMTSLLYLCIVGVGLFTICRNDICLPLALDVLPFTLGFFALGVLFQHEIKGLTPSRNKCIVLTVLFVGFYWVEGLHCNVRTSAYNPIYIGWIVCLCASLIFIFAVKCMEPHILKLNFYKFLSNVGRNTLVIYLLHMEILRILPLQRLGGESVFQTTVVQIVVTLSVLYIITLFGKLIHRYWPWSLGR